MEEVKERQSRRFQFLQHLYNETNKFYAVQARAPSQIPIFCSDELGNELGFTQVETQQIVAYLSEEGLVDIPAVRRIALNHAGVVEIESAFVRPEQPTDHFPANVVQYIVNAQQITDSPIQQGTLGSTIVTVPPNALQQVQEFIGMLKPQLRDLPISGEGKAEAEAEIATVESQVQSPRPKRNIIRLSIETLKRILESIPADVAAEVIRDHLPALVRKATELLQALS
jgi:hypothetical protein